jgi:poly-gamma-glutamate biosynthesis protein PgsC/CapC
MNLETIFIGIVVALLYTEFMGFYPGGIIVPAFIALSLDRPSRALVTLLTACLSLLVYKLISRYFILFGKRRFVIMILLGGFWAQLWLILSPSFFSGSPEFRAVGLIIPGLLANNLERQKFLPTLASLVTVVVITYFLASLIGMAR